jgi:hypothetical protein
MWPRSAVALSYFAFTLAYMLNYNTTQFHGKIIIVFLYAFSSESVSLDLKCAIDLVFTHG